MARRGRRLAAGGVAAVAAAACAAVPAAAAAVRPAATAARPAATAAARPAVRPAAQPAFGAVVVDAAHHHVFVSLPSANAIDVFDESGDLLGTIPHVYGAWGMVVVGPYLYVAESTTGEVVRLTLSGANPPATVASGLNEPSELVGAGGKLWVALAGDDGQWEDSVVSINPSTGAVTPIPVEIDYPDLAAAPGNPKTLYVDEDGQSPGEIYAFDVATNPATETLDVREDDSNIQDMAVSPDGTRVIPAAGSPYEFQELSASTLQPDGLIYPAQPYPDAVATSSSDLLATGLDLGTPDISVFKFGVPQAIFTANTNPAPNGIQEVLPHGLALTPDGSELFAVAASSTGGLLFDTFDLSGPGSASTAVTTHIARTAAGSARRLSAPAVGFRRRSP